MRQVISEFEKLFGIDNISNKDARSTVRDQLCAINRPRTVDNRREENYATENFQQDIVFVVLC
jgi:hypothetical protein